MILIEEMIELIQWKSFDSIQAGRKVEEELPQIYEQYPIIEQIRLVNMGLLLTRKIILAL